MIKKWKLLEKKETFKSSFITLYKEKLKRGDGKVVEDYYSVKRRDAVFVVALNKKLDIVLVYQYKNGIKDLIWEVPAGYVDENETPLQAAQRELLEETGFQAGEFISLGGFNPGPSIGSNCHYAFLALNCEKISEQKLDENEDIDVKTFSFREVTSSILQRKSMFIDNQSPYAILLAKEVLKERGLIS